MYADDLNGYKPFENNIGNDIFYVVLRGCQTNLHSWGKANGVSFASAKESFHIVSRSRPDGDPFRILGVTFDCKLVMSDAVTECVHECGWRVLCLLRGRRYHTQEEILMLYKAHVLSYIEYRTCAFAHASDSVLIPFDNVQRDLFTAGVYK